MKKQIAYLLALVFLLSSLNRLWVMANYSVNYTYIIENLCENKDRPEMLCNGFCYIDGQLKSIDLDDYQSSKTFKIKPLVLFIADFFGSSITFRQHFVLVSQNFLTSFYLLKAYAACMPLIDPPPCV